jgi:hypothetical protein
MTNVNLIFLKSILIEYYYMEQKPGQHRRPNTRCEVKIEYIIKRNKKCKKGFKSVRCLRLM